MENFKIGAVINSQFTIFFFLNHWFEYLIVLKYLCMLLILKQRSLKANYELCILNYKLDK